MRKLHAWLQEILMNGKFYEFDNQHEFVNKNDHSNPANYRPISLTCITSKIFEHIIASHIMHHLETNSILYDLPHGFRRNRSCETQLISFIHKLTMIKISSLLSYW